MGHRRKAREYALQGLYMYEISKTSVNEVIPLNWVDIEISDDVKDFTSLLINGTIENIVMIDDTIKEHSKNWKLERLSVVDKSILRLSIYEIIFLPDIPDVVAINEGIELGKIYGGENSGQFINGILDAVKKSKTVEEEQLSNEL